MEGKEVKFLRVISEQYFGYLVGQVREVLEASFSNEKQQKAIESIVLDRMYGWFQQIGDKLTEEEWDEASRKHWNNMNLCECGGTHEKHLECSEIK